jgi:hypothetical protein
MAIAAILAAPLLDLIVFLVRRRHRRGRGRE